MWIWLILGIILSVALMLPATYEAPSNEVKVETITAAVSAEDLLDELEEWDIQDHIEELLDEDEEEELG